MTWIELSIEVAAAQAEAASEAFHSAGALSVTAVDAANEPLLEPAPGETPLWSQTRLVALFERDVDVDTVMQSLRASMADPTIQCRQQQLQDRDWSTTWRDDFSAMQFGRRLWVCPLHETPPAAPACVVQMDPGMAFGTGSHATTRLCLEWLDANAPVGKRVLDYGCGSGILAIAACKLGAEKAYAVDIDPQALLATRENARRNAVVECLEAYLPGELRDQPVDLLMANILANPLIEMAEELAARVCAGGRIIMTGILREQQAAVTAACQAWFEFERPVIREEWVLLEGVRRRGSQGADH